jgi:hypothetical protein
MTLFYVVMAAIGCLLLFKGGQAIKAVTTGVPPKAWRVDDNERLNWMRRTAGLVWAGLLLLGASMFLVGPVLWVVYFVSGR